ncbi:MAG: aminotransferase class IV family protein [Candidatus Omnitrophica bacterium]|nr:aminotransferase class IV family protein [Candidatus Omnitrophota bacterium]
MIPPPPFDASGVFETCRVKKGTVLHLEEHLDRLRSSLKTLGLPPSGEQEARDSLKESARGILDGYVRIAIRRAGKPRMVIHRHPRIPYSREQIREGVSLTTVPTPMPPVEAVQARVKSSERLSSVLARMEAPGAVEVLRIGPQGYLTEGTISNLFLVKGKTILTPPAWLGVLEGVTRAHVIEAAGRLRITVQEIPVTRHDLFNAEEAFLTNVLMGILPIRQADGRKIGAAVPGPITRRLMQAIAQEEGAS